MTRIIKPTQKTKASQAKAEALRVVRVGNKTEKSLLDFIFFGEKVPEPSGLMAGASKASA